MSEQASDKAEGEKGGDDDAEKEVEVSWEWLSWLVLKLLNIHDCVMLRVKLLMLLNVVSVMNVD